MKAVLMIEKGLLPRKSTSFYVMLIAFAFMAQSVTGTAAEPWRQIGPVGAGSFDSMVVNPQDPLTMYASNSLAGVSKSMDGGLSWAVLPQSPKLIGRLQIHPKATSTLYIEGGDIFKSEDGGESWVSIQPSGNDPAYQFVFLKNLVLDPGSPQILYAEDGFLRDHPNRSIHGNDGGISRSLDGGRTWHQVNEGFPQSESGLLVEATALAIDPVNPMVVYAGLVELRSGLDDPSQTPKKMLYRSVDGGDFWEKVSDYFWVIDRIVFDPADTAVIYVVARNSTHLLHRSLDGGKSWKQFGPPGLSVYYMESTNPSTIISHSGGRQRQEIWKSVDRGDTWESFTLPVQISSFHFSATANVLYAAADGVGNGLYESLDGGETWRQFSNGVSDKVIGQIKVGAAGGSTLYASETAGKIYRSHDRGKSWVAMESFRPPPNKYYQYDISLAVDSVTPALYVSARADRAQLATNSLFVSSDEGSSWNELATPPYFGPTSILTHPWDPSILFIGTQDTWSTEAMLFRSFDSGESWESMLTFWYGDMVPVMDPLDPSTVYVAGNSGASSLLDDRFMKTVDGGDTWVQHQDGLPMDKWGRFPAVITNIAIDAFNTNNLVVAADREIYKTTDGAGFWWRVDKNWPDDVRPLDILIDPLVSSTMYAATQDRGVLRSVDGGVTWDPYSEGLFSGRVYDLEFDEETREIFAATGGGGVFVRPTVDAGMEDFAIFADPNPIRVCGGQAGSTRIEWRSPRNYPVKVRIGSSDGPLFTHTVRRHSKVTGNWVREGMQFYLLDGYSGGVLAQTTVRVTDSGCKPFAADPNPIQVCQGSVGETTLSWSLSDKIKTEIRIGSPTGKLMARGGHVGKIQTRNWVRDGMQFFLLDQTTQEVLSELQVRHTQDSCFN